MTTVLNPRPPHTHANTGSRRPDMQEATTKAAATAAEAKASLPTASTTTAAPASSPPTLTGGGLLALLPGGTDRLVASFLGAPQGLYCLACSHRRLVLPRLQPSKPGWVHLVRAQEGRGSTTLRQQGSRGQGSTEHHTAKSTWVAGTVPSPCPCPCFLPCLNTSHSTPSTDQSSGPKSKHGVLRYHPL